jgi:hypothetical protein
MQKLCTAILGTALAFGSVHATELKGTVLLPDGKPAALAEVAAFVTGHPLRVRQNMMLDLVNQDRVTKADENGQFSFTPAGDATEVYATHAAGYAELTIAQLAAATNQIILQPWGRIEGTLTVGGKPQNDWWISANDAVSGRTISRDFTTFGARTDADGRFVLTNVPAGEWRIANQAIGRNGNMRQDLAKQVSVKPGETVKLQLGADGHTVTGRLTVKPALPNINWREAELNLAGWRGFAAADGSFTIEGVAGGTNELSVLVVQNSLVVPHPGGPEQMIIAEGKKTIVMPEAAQGGTNTAFDVGTIELHPVNPPRTAPHL